MKTAFIYDPIFLEHQTPSYHPESPKRLVAIINSIEAYPDLKDDLIFLSPRKATKDEILLAHDEGYFEKVESTQHGYLDSDTYVSPGTFEAALYAAGAVLTAVDAIKTGKIKAAFCAVRPPGHHAESDRGMGFCIFNNVAVGAMYAIRNNFDRTFIIDFDVHHGNGTEHIFYKSDRVFYFSTHQSPLYPGTGRKNDKGEGRGLGTNFNYPLPPGSGDDDIIKPYKEILPDLIADFNPEIVFVSAGYDIRDADPLASLEVSVKGIEKIVKEILMSIKDRPVVFTLEGGYNLQALAESVIVTLKSLVNW